MSHCQLTTRDLSSLPRAASLLSSNSQNGAIQNVLTAPKHHIERCKRGRPSDGASLCRARQLDFERLSCPPFFRSHEAPFRFAQYAFIRRARPSVRSDSFDGSLAAEESKGRLGAEKARKTAKLACLWWPQLDALELAEFKHAISLHADTRHGERPTGTSEPTTVELLPS